jgi:hypothetical protein
MNTAECPYCRGAKEVWDVVDDVEFRFPCVCVGGNEDSVRWLLDMQEDLTSNAPEMIIVPAEELP